MLRILYLSDVYFPRVNGVSTSIRTFRRELQALGHEVVVVAPDYPGSAQVTEAGIVRVASRVVPFDPEDRLMRGRALRELPARLGAQAFDLVHIQTPFAAHYAGLQLGRELDIPCVATYHTFFEEYLYHYVPFAPRALLRALARDFSRRQANQVDALVVPSHAMLSTLTAYGARAPMTILPTGIRLEELAGGDGAAFRRRHGIRAERPLLVHIGRVAFEKNIDILEGGKGAVIAAPDEQAFADAVCRLLDSPALRRRLGAEGRQYAAQWDAARQAQRLADFYAAVLAGRAAGVAAHTRGSGTCAAAAGNRIDRRGARRP